MKILFMYGSTLKLEIYIYITHTGFIVFSFSGAWHTFYKMIGKYYSINVDGNYLHLAIFFLLK